MSALEITCHDATTMLLPKLRPRVQGLLLEVRGGRLHVELAGVDTQLPLVGSIDLAVSLTAQLMAPQQVSVGVRVERVLGPLAMVIRPLMKQILQAAIPEPLRGAIVVESPTLLRVDLTQLKVKEHPVTALAEVAALQLPAGANAARLEFRVLRLP